MFFLDSTDLVPSGTNQVGISIRTLAMMGWDGVNHMIQNEDLHVLHKLVSLTNRSLVLMDVTNLVSLTGSRDLKTQHLLYRGHG